MCGRDTPANIGPPVFPAVPGSGLNTAISGRE